MIPDSYEQWRECIEVHCKIRLTPAFIEGRLAELRDGDHAQTKAFAKLYGAGHLAQTIAWFDRAANEVS